MIPLLNDLIVSVLNDLSGRNLAFRKDLGRHIGPSSAGALVLVLVLAAVVGWLTLARWAFRRRGPWNWLLKGVSVVGLLACSILPIVVELWGYPRIRDAMASNLLMSAAIGAALVGLATTPLAFALLGQLNFFEARRGRVNRKPSYSSIVCGMLLVMGIPAIFMALTVKSESFDRNRYEFDPNKTWSVLDQGRGFRSVKEADEAVRQEMKRLAEERKNLVNNVKKLDEAMLSLRAASRQAPAVAQTLPTVLERLAGVRESVGVDAPQQLMDFTAPPAALGNEPVPVVASVAAPTTPQPTASEGMTQAQVDAELATVPDPQRPIAAMLPFLDLPAGWSVGKSGPSHLETFNADNLFEKIDGRAESFLQYDVKGMAYTFYHPTADESNEVQLYIFEMGSPLKALGKYGSEKPDGVATIPVGAEGYSSAGSTLFHADKYYTQIVSTRDEPKFAAFALELAKRIAAKQGAAAPSPGAAPAPVNATPEAIFALLPDQPKKLGTKYVAQDVFGYSFLSDVFMADYQEGAVAWQGFIRPYENPDAAKVVFQKYLDGAKEDGAEIKKVDAEGADEMVVCSNIGLVDVIFRKGNVVAGANGATDPAPAEAFARAFAKALPASVPALSPAQGPPPDAPADAAKAQ